MKHKTEMKDFINKNSELFNSEEPKDGHFSRFEAKLQNKKKSNNVFKLSLKYAAAVIILVSSFFIYENYKNTENQKQFAETNKDANEEFNEIETFYTSQLETKYNELDAVSCKQGNLQKQTINEDLSDLDEEYQDLLEEYKANPENIAIKNALIKNYRMRIDILDMVISTLKNYC